MEQSEEVISQIGLLVANQWQEKNLDLMPKEFWMKNMEMENGRKGQELNIINLKSMPNATSDNISKKKDFWIIGWKLNSDRSSSDFYMIFLPGERDVPLMNKGKIVLYSYEGIKGMLSEKEILYQEFNDMVDLVCDVDCALNIISKRKVDNKSIILNVLNFLIDGSNALKANLPKRQKIVLYKFADYLTFNKNIELFFKTKYSRSEVRESIYTLLGLTLGNSTFSDL